MIEGVILAGGRGERFWPVSRRAHPKQLVRLFGERSLVRLAWERLRHRLPAHSIWVLTGADLAADVRRELPEIDPRRLIAEPVGRNTATAAAVAAALGLRDGGAPLQLVVAADHWIPSTADFWADVDRAAAVADAADAPLVTFGIPITRAEVGYGYVERGDPRPETAGAYAVRRFHEKPKARTARRYRDSGRHYWNSGIFLWQARAFGEEVARHMPPLWDAVRGLISSPQPLALIEEVYRGSPAASIDHGILERCDRVAVVAAGFAWNDVGNWNSWADLAIADGQGNALRGDVTAIDSRDCVLVAEDGLIATLGVRDLVVVRARDVTLVVPRGRCHEIPEILKALRETGAEQHL